MEILLKTEVSIKKMLTNKAYVCAGHQYIQISLAGQLASDPNFSLVMKPIKRNLRDCELHIWSVSSPLVGHGTLYRCVGWFGFVLVEVRGGSFPPSTR